MAKKSKKAQSANANKANKANANNQTNEMANLLAIGAITQEEFELTEEQKAIVEVVSEINNALGITPNEAEAEAEAEAEKKMTDEEKNTIIKNTTKNQLEECAKRVQKEVNSLNGALKALYKEDIYKKLFEALDCKNYDEARLKVLQSIAFASEDNDGKFCAVTLKPIARFNNISYYKVVKLGWFKAIAQSTYRLARGLQRKQNLLLDSFYTKREKEDIWDEVSESATIAEIEQQIKIDKYNKLCDRVNKAKLEI